MQPLPYWIEHDENNNPKNYIWVKVPKINAGINKLYIYKRNGFKPNGEDVFIFFDDFDESYLDKWEMYSDGGATLTQTDGKIKISGSSSYNGAGLAGITTVPFDNLIVESYVMREGGNKNGAWGTLTGLTDKQRIVTRYAYAINCTTIFAGISEYTSNSWRMNIQNRYDGYNTVSNTGNSADFEPWDGVWMRARLLYDHQNQQIYGRFIYQNIDQTLGPLNMSYSLIELHPQIHYVDYSNTGLNSYFEWYFVRKYVVDEPTIKIVKHNDYYEILIDSTVNISDYQIAVPISELDISSINESLYISQYKKPSKAWIFSLGGIIKNFKTNSYIEAITRKNLYSNIANETVQTTSTKTSVNIEVVDTITKNATLIVDTTQQLENTLSNVVNIQKSIQNMLSSITDLSYTSRIDSAISVEMLQNIFNNISSLIETTQTLTKDISVLNDVALLTIIREHASILNELLSTNNYSVSSVAENIKEIEQAYSKLINIAISTETKLSGIQNSVINLQEQLNSFIEIIKTEEFSTATAQELVSSIERKVSVFNELVETIDQLIIKLRTVLEKANVYRTLR